ncbi:ankyrin repeat-containing domain protein [Apiospora rasikravindrae]|uniref:Ankyrin repeat-containing domain protein n=1 Tax=Apiospora rasikravindrae TaxID=990691 RepID=A0ABR1TC93_9PEZI
MDINTLVSEDYTSNLRPITEPEIGVSIAVNQRLKRERDVLSQFGRMSALGYAIYVNGCGNDYDILRVLLEAGGDPNSNARIGIADSKVRYADPDTIPKNTAMATPLLLAIEHKDIGMLELLVERGADVNKPASQGLHYTPLQLACKLGSLEKVEFLLQRGADVRAGPSLAHGGTALQMAAQAGNIKIAQLLLDNGATVHEAPSRAHGRTAFEGAAEMGRITMLQFLWERACPRGFEQAEVERARKFAEKEGHGGCVQFIELLLIIVGGATPRLSPGPM